MNKKLYGEELVKGKPFYPLAAFRNKLFLYIITAFIGISTGIFGLAGFIIFVSSFDSDPADSQFGQWLAASSPGLVLFYLLFWLGLIPILAVLVDYYVRKMEFAILDNEVIVKKGIINRTIKHIPFRTITNVSSRYGVYDRLLGIGTVQIETAGKSGQQTGPEAKIEGINNFTQVRDLILEALRQFRGQYATATELEPRLILPTTDQGFHKDMVAELREIKEILSK